MSLKPKMSTSVGLNSGEKGDELARLQRLLLDVGYLQHLDDGLVEIGDPGRTVGFLKVLGEFDQPTARALKAFQQSNGLSPSSVLDKATLSFMNQIFCLSKAVELAADFAGQKRVYTYSILNEHPALPGSVLPRAIEQAFAMWAVETPLAFIPVTADANPDITFRFAHIQTGYGNAGIEFEDQVNWVLDGFGRGSNRIDFISVALHEIGHRLGLSHASNNSDSIMRFSLSSDSFYRILVNHDKAIIHAAHGEPVIQNSLWVHGTSVTPEKQSQLSDFQPKGPFAVVIGKGGVISAWFHFALPTPAIYSKDSVRLHGIRLKLRTYPKSSITKVHIWDGNSFLAQHLLSLGGSPTEDIPKQWDLRLGVARKPIVTTGVGISIEVKFGHGSTDSRSVEFVGAGAEFIGRRLTDVSPVFDFSK